MKKIIVLLIMLISFVGFSQQPSTNAPTPPARDAADVISIFSGAYTQIANTNFIPNWGQSGLNNANTAFEPENDGNLVLAYPNFNYQGVNIGCATCGDGIGQNISDMDFLHVDIWIEGPFTPRIFVISSGGEIPHPVPSPVQGQWITVEIPVTGITGDLTNARQFKFDGGVSGNSAIYLDNIYFYKTQLPVNDVTGDVYINDGTFAAGDFTTAGGQDIATNDGSAAEPFATLDYALARSTQAPGDVIYIDAGTYSWASTHALTDSGTSANPITLQGKGNNETNITTTAVSTTSAGLHFTTGNHWVVKDLNWTATAARAVWVANVDGIVLDNCTINISTSAALQSIIIGTAGGELTIKNSTLTRSNTAFHMIEVVAGTTLIMQDNTSSFSALAAVGTASSVKITPNTSSVFILERNKFNNGGYGIHFNAGPPATVASASSIIKNNFFKTYWGLINQSITDLTVHNNSFYTNGESIYGIGVGSLTSWDIRNNILYTYGSSRACILSESATSHPAIMDYNHYYSPNTGAARQGSSSGPILSFTAWQNAAGGPWETNGQGGNVPSFDPLYVDAPNGDLHLHSDSPAIGAGVDVGITDDIDGDARPFSDTFDMGADEFNACTAVLGATITTCDSFGVGATDDTYTATVTYTGANNGNDFIVTSTAGIVSGDDPDNVTNGTIIITGIAEGTDITVTLSDTADGGLCSLSANISSPQCTPPPTCSDVLLENFDGTPPTLSQDNGAPIPNLVSDPDPNKVGIGRDQVLEIITNAGGAPWQQAELVLQNDNLDLTTDKTVSIDWYSEMAFDALIRVDARVSGAGSASATAEAVHPGGGWQTLVFDFNQQAQNLGIPNGVYSELYFFNLWDISSGDFTGGPTGSTASVTYVDNIYQGTVNKTVYTYNNGWLSPGDPTGSSDCGTINIVSGDITIVSDTEIENLTIAPGASLTVPSGVTLTATKVNLNSESSTFSSLIVDGTLLGTLSYSRFTSSMGPDGTNDLIASPVSGQDFGPFAEANPNLAASGDLRAFAPYNTISGNYENYNIAANVGTTIGSGIGFRAATTDGSNLIFSGTLLETEPFNVTISSAGAGNAWNLIGNPYPSYLDFAAFFNTDNKLELDPGGAFQAVYGYNGDGWTVWNQASIDDNSETELIAPGQAFFVKSVDGGGSVRFTKAMAVIGSSDDFIAGRNSNDLDVAASKLILSSAENSTYTKIYFIEGNTRGLDQGYDAGAYGNSSGSFSIFTNLVENNQGLDMAIQTLGYDDFNDVVIPVGVKASAGTSLTISLGSNTSLPLATNIYLEDTQENTFTLLNTNDYTFTPLNDLIGTGRFYLRYSSVVLSENPNNGINDLIIYTDNATKDIIIKGMLTDDTTTDLYDIQGRLVLSEKLDQSISSLRINVSSMSAGIYVIKVSNTNGTKTQKLIIK